MNENDAYCCEDCKHIWGSRCAYHNKELKTPWLTICDDFKLWQSKEVKAKRVNENQKSCCGGGNCGDNGKSDKPDTYNGWF